MEVMREEKVEALRTLVEFNPKVIHNIKIIIKELSGARMDDTKMAKAFEVLLPELDNIQKLAEEVIA